VSRPDAPRCSCRRQTIRFTERVGSEQIQSLSWITVSREGPAIRLMVLEDRTAAEVDPTVSPQFERSRIPTCTTQATI